jgi:hypothetical protein
LSKTPKPCRLSEAITVTVALRRLAMAFGLLLSVSSLAA